MKKSALDAARLACGQQALWYLNQLEPNSTAYHLGICLELTGALDEQALAAAWREIGQAHPQLRTRFPLQNDQPSMVINPATAPLRVAMGGAGEVAWFWKEVAERPFDLANESPIRALLLRGLNGRSHLLLCSHHIVSDLWSSAIILRELSLGYQSRVSGQSVPVIASEQMSYTDFTTAEQQWLASSSGIATGNFWQAYFAGARLDTILTQRIADGKAGAVPIVLKETEARLVRTVAQKTATTPYTVLLACYAQLLGEETRRDEVIIGTSATLRDHAALRDTVGYFVNAVPVRCSVGMRGENSVAAVAVNARSALKHRRFPFPALVEKLGIPRTPDINPIFQTMFAYQALPRSDRQLLPLALNQPGAKWEFGGGLTAQTVAMPAFDAQFPIALILGPIEAGFSGSLQYDGCRVTAANATRLVQWFPELIREFLTTRKSAATPAVKAEPVERLDHLFDATARRMPEAIATSEGGVTLSYVEVNAKAEAIARSLNAVLPADARPVALQIPSCATAAIVILAILKSGRTFQPIDPTEPEARRNAALQRTNACALLSPAGIDPGILPAGILALDPEKLSAPNDHPIRIPTPARTAYLIFTSGSAGEPKAVAVEHAALINHAQATARLFGLKPTDRILQFHTLAFDAAYEEIFPSWSSGACVVFEPQARELGIPAFLEVIKQDAITVLNLPTSYWHLLTAEAARLPLPLPVCLRLLVVGGESASAKSYAAWRKLAPDCRWINTYGPTEATITALAYEPAANATIQDSIPIGQPIAGVSTLLLDETGEPVSVGEGELLLGGKGLARGYHGAAEITAAKFITRSLNGEKQRFYRTGDRVRLRGDGNFEYLGRLDRQLKIRGYRIEPDEIERALCAHPSVNDAVVMPEEIKGELILAGWVTRAAASLTECQLRAHLLQSLPAHMIPTRLIFVARIPRKPSGKIDRTELAQIRPQRIRRDDRGPQEMVNLFSELLGHKIDPQDDFFLSGGHSLLGIKLLGRIEVRFGVRVSLADFVAAPTAEALWKHVQATPTVESTNQQEITPSETLISAQQSRALLAHEIGQPSLANIVLLLQVDGELDNDTLAQAIETVAQQNFLLRAGFLRNETGILLRESTKLPKLEQRILSASDFKNAIVQLAQAEGDKPFPLDGDSPWIRILLISAPKGRSRFLLLVTHHAVADGWAFELLLEDLRNAYGHTHKNGNGSPKAVRDYRLYALQQSRWLKSHAARRQISFWQKHLAGIESPRLPFRRPTSANTSWQAEHHEVTLSPQLSRELRRLAAAYGVTPFALVMACFKALIHRHAGQTDITLGSVVSNRTAPTDQNVFGPLQNAVLIRNEVTSDLPLRKLAQRVARSLTEAQANGDLPFEQVIREALPQHLPLLEGGIQFLSHDQTRRELRLGSASLCPVELQSGKAPFELSVAVAAAAHRVKISFEYQPSAYTGSGIKCLAQQYVALLQAIIKTPTATVAELNLIPAAQLRALQRRVFVIHVPKAELLHDGFESQVRRNPRATAVIARERSFTYGELDSMARLTAQVLTENGLKERGLVAVMLPKGWEQIVACLAILKAGGVYVPLDPALPTTRLNAIFAQGGFCAVIVADADSHRAPRIGRRIPVITIHSRPERTPKTRQRPRPVKPNSLAYIIFTSGTTGIPKGVMISHQAAMTTIAEINRRFQLQSNDRVFAVSALGFDLSVFDIFGTLRAGGTIVMPESQDPKEWLKQASAAKITVWNSVPCLFELLLDEANTSSHSLASLRLIMLSGDFISLALARRVRSKLPHSRFVSLGGATEAAIWSIAHEIKSVDPAWPRVPYGRPLRQQEMFVLDERLNHCAIGVTGELFIAGAGLADGYWKNRLETKRRFLRHPRWKIRLYRTGDKGRYLENGDIEILGRLDEQVKVNGVRIELGEVEAALCLLPSVRQAITEVRSDGAGNKTLVAFVAAEPGTSSTALLSHAKKTLPAAFIPANFVVMDRLPLAGNGKIDRTALRVMNLPLPIQSAEPPETSAEVWIVNLWHDLLGGINVGVNDDFFALGGHSLLAIKMLQRVRSHFAVELPLSLIVERPTVRGLAAAATEATFAPKAGLTQRATAELERDTEPVLSPPLRQTSQSRDAVFLTGVTGHLGLAVLRELLKKTAGRIYCLVRASSISEAEMRIGKTLSPHIIETDQRTRIVAIPGDLGRKHLGLESSAFAKLASEVRAIYHCAAEVNFIAPYEKLAPTNVGGVREMIRLTSAADAVLHHVSSVAVFPYGDTRILREDEDIARVQSLIGGYAQSKWVSERMVWKAIARGLRAVIYRPAQIIGRRNGAPHDLFDHALHVCRTLRAVPDLEANMDLVTSDYAAAAIFALSTKATSCGKAFHLVHPAPVSLRDFVNLFPKPLPLVPVDSWLTSLHQQARQGDDASLHFVSLLAQGLERSDLTPPSFDCRETMLGLKGSGIVCPPLDRQFILRELVSPEEHR